MGVSQGVIFTNSLTYASSLKQAFELNEPKFYDGAEILKHVYNKYDILNSLDKLVVNKFLLEGEWKKRWNVFMGSKIISR